MTVFRSVETKHASLQKSVPLLWTAFIEKNVSFHTSRHAFAVLALAAGGDIYTVGKLLGHTSISSTQVYADVVMETKIEAVNRFTNYFSGQIVVKS